MFFLAADAMVSVYGCAIIKLLSSPRRILLGSCLKCPSHVSHVNTLNKGEEMLHARDGLYLSVYRGVQRGGEGVRGTTCV